jgi:hypothetical protein
LGLSALDSFGVAISNLKIEATAPIDFELTSELLLKNLTKMTYNRFFIRSGAQIKTNGHDLVIDVNKLYVDPDSRRVNFRGWSSIHSNILTYHPGEIAKDRHQAIQSNIIIRANEAFGSLTVALVGIAGRDGKSGQALEKEKNISREIDPKLRGADGIAGLSTEIHGRCRAGAAMDAQAQCGSSTFRCERQPTNGTDGRKGANGTDGEDGTRGGNAGSLKFLINNHQQFKADVFVRAGKGGIGGIGSDRFKGGIGGAAGTNVQGCVAAQKGANGPSGDRDGKNGADADDGDTGTIINGGVSVSTFPF